MKTGILFLLFIFSQNLFSQDTLSSQLQMKLLLDISKASNDTIFTKKGKVKFIIYNAREVIFLENLASDPTRVLGLSHSYKDYKELLKNIELTTYLDFISKLSTSSKIDRSFFSNSELNIKYVDKKTINKLFDTIIERYATSDTGQLQSFVEISNVGFNTTKTQAIIYYGKSYGPLAGSGYVCLYELRNSKWSMVEKKMLWIS